MKKDWHTIWWYTLLFGCTAVLGYAVLIAARRTLIWNIDGIGQYYPSFLYIGKYLRNFLAGILHGSFTLPAYDLSIGFGEDIIGTLNYYGFGDPLNLLAVFADTGNGVVLFTALFFLRAWLSGLAFLLYCSCFQYNGRLTSLGAVSYAFCGFGIFGCTRYSQWYSLLILFPLLLAGCEMVFKRQPHGGRVLTLSVCYGALCGFYFLYNASLVLAVYCLVRQLGIRSEKRIARTVKECLRCLGYYILGLCLASPVFLPASAGFFDSENAEYSALSVICNLKNYLPAARISFWKSLLIPFYAEKDLAAGIGVLETAALLILFAGYRKTHRHQLLRGAFLAELIALHLPITGYLFNAFNEENNRWIFVIHFTLALVLVEVLQSIVCEKAYRRLAFLSGKKALLPLLAVAVIAGTVGNIWLLFSPAGSNFSAYFMTGQQVETYVDSPVNYAETLREDTSLYRVGTGRLLGVNGRPSNVAMLYGYHSLQYWFSISNTRVQRLVDLYFGRPMIGRAMEVNKEPAMESLLGVRYKLVKAGREAPEGWERIERIRFAGKRWDVYQNPDWFGMAYLRSQEEASALWQQAVQTEQQKAYFARMLREWALKTASRIEEPERNADSFRFVVEAENGEELIVSIPYQKNWQLLVDGERVQTECRDILFLAVPLSAGTHEVILRYVPLSFYAGCILCALTCCVLALMGYFRKRRKQAALTEQERLLN